MESGVRRGKQSLEAKQKEVRHGNGSLEWNRQRKDRNMGDWSRTDRIKTCKGKQDGEQTEVRMNSGAWSRTDKSKTWNVALEGEQIE